jgi:hypothetical protein
VREFGVEVQDNKEKVDNFNIYFESSFSDSRFDSQNNLLKPEFKPKDISFLSPTSEKSRNPFQNSSLKKFNMIQTMVKSPMVNSPSLCSKSFLPSTITKGSSQSTNSALSESTYDFCPCSFPVLIPSKNCLKRFSELKGKLFAYKNLGIPIVILFYFYFFI